MTRVLAIALLSVSASFAQAADILVEAVLVAENQSTNPLAFPGMFDVYEVVADNSANATDVIALEINLPGDYIQAGNTTFKEGTGLPVIFGSAIPDTFFPLPAGAAELAVDTVDDATGIASSFSTQGGLTLVPAGGSAPILVVSVAAGTPFELAPGFVLGRADIGGEFASLVAIPEPATALIASLGLVGFAARRRG